MNILEFLFSKFYTNRKIFGPFKNSLYTFFIKKLVPQEGEIMNIRQGVAKDLGWKHYNNYSNLYWLGLYDSKIQKILSLILKEGMAFYDIGANAGFFSVVAKRLVGSSGKVYAFEPLAKNIFIIKTQAAINNMNISIIEAAVSNKTGEIDFIMGDNHDVGTVIEKTRKYVSSIENRLTVKTVSISDFIYKLGKKRPDVIKIDVEGAEGLVIQGMNKMFVEGLFPVMIIELHGPECKEAVITPLLANNYSFYNLDLKRVKDSQINPRHQFVAIRK